MVRPPLQRLGYQRKKQAQIIVLSGYTLRGVTQYHLDHIAPFTPVAQPRRNRPAEIMWRCGVLVY